MRILIDGQTLETDEINRGIGKYFKSVINNIVKMDFVNEWYITVSDKKYLKVLDPWVAEKIIVIEEKSYSPTNFNTNGYNANLEYSMALEKVIAEYQIDTYWNPNPVMVNVLFPLNKLKVNMYITFYDLIPYVFSEQYLKQWPRELVEEYKRRLNYINSPECNVLFISEATKKDFDKYIGTSYKGSKVTFLGAEPKEFYKPYSVYKGKKESSIVFVGGFDFRKNLYKAVEAFAEAKQNHKNTVMDKAKLYLVCKCVDEEREKFNAFLKKLDMQQDVILTGFVSDQELSHIYNTCDVFFFPSIYEGFGLPILEALLAGCYILAGDNSSLPEVGKNYIDYCNVLNTDEMSEKLFEALVKSTQEGKLKKEERKKYALQFTWENTARSTLDFLLKKDQSQKMGQVKKPKIAIVTPWAPQQTGIANFVSKLLPELEKYMEIDLYVDDTKIKITEYQEYKNGSIFSINDLPNNKERYSQIIYQLGNNSEFHTKIYEMALKIPGIVEIHDYIMHPFMYHSFYLEKKYEYYKEALAYYGVNGKEHYEAVINRIADPDIYRFPMVEYICSKSKATIVHSRWVANQLSDIHNVYVIPHPCFDKYIEEEKLDVETFRQKYKVSPKEFVVGCMGFVNKNKRPYTVIEAVSQLKDMGYPIKLIFFGNAGEYKKELEELIEEKGVKDNVIITGYVNEMEYIEGLVYSDIIVNLRYPSMGESSGTLCEAFQYGKPVIVSNINQYREYPDEVCWKVDVGEQEINQLSILMQKLFKNKKVRNILGENAEYYAQSILGVDEMGQVYHKYIQDTIARGRFGV